jgi:predicted Zn-dependent protease
MDQKRITRKLCVLSLPRLVLLGAIFWAVLLTLAGCRPPGEWGHQGPGHRRQSLALTPTQELSLGRQAYREILSKYRVLPKDSQWVQTVTRVGQRLQKAAGIELLQREINLDVRGYIFEWEYNVLEDNQVNAFCLPGGKIGVFTGLLNLIKNDTAWGKDQDSQLATVLGHEMAHALAHHASERIARHEMTPRAVEAARGAFGRLDSRDRDLLIGLMGGGEGIFSLRFDRQQETEADHIGLFLMTFAKFDPRQAVVFWQKMERLSRNRAKPPAILSTHPSDAVRIRQMEEWIPYAEAALKAYESGNVVKER